MNFNDQFYSFQNLPTTNITFKLKILGENSVQNAEVHCNGYDVNLHATKATGPKTRMVAWN